jgi:hypothetical protein
MGNSTIWLTVMGEDVYENDSSIFIRLQERWIPHPFPEVHIGLLACPL